MAVKYNYNKTKLFVSREAISIDDYVTDNNHDLYLFAILGEKDWYHLSERVIVDNLTKIHSTANAITVATEWTKWSTG
jgi:hypothetical protein